MNNFNNKNYVNVVSPRLSLNILLYKVNDFPILTRHLSHTLAITFAVWVAIEKLAWISFSFFTVSQTEDLFLL